MTPDALALARRRLQLGITNIGFWVVAASGGLFFLCKARPNAISLSDGALVFAAAVAAQAVFDFLGGRLLMPEPRPTMRAYLRSWSRGVTAHSLVLAGIGVLSYASFQLTGGFGASILVATAGLALGRRFLLRAVAGVVVKAAPTEGESRLIATATDPAFTGGILGLGPTAQTLLPERWLASESREDLAAESVRRQWQLDNALPLRTFLVVLGWNLLGGWAGSTAFELAARTPAEALVGYACWMTLWAFGGLLILPALSRPAVFAADRAALDAGHDPRRWIARFPNLVGEDGSPSGAVQAIFYPIPSARWRLDRLATPVSGFIPGHLARANLYYSWATLTLVGRAVHCNIGRPALWVFPPSA